MKTFASIAILAASVAAVNTQATATAGIEDTYSDLFKSNHVAHHHDHPVVHIDIW
jgi:chromosome segregation ATPase